MVDDARFVSPFLPWHPIARTKTATTDVPSAKTTPVPFISSSPLSRPGAILYRAGKYEQSLVHQLQAVDLGNAVPRAPLIGEPTMGFWLAMTHHKLGHDAEARKLLTKAIARTDEILEQELEAYKSLFWSERIWFEALRDEAIGLIGTSSKSNDGADLQNERTEGSVS